MNYISECSVSHINMYEPCILELIQYNYVHVYKVSKKAWVQISAKSFCKGSMTQYDVERT